MKRSLATLQLNRDRLELFSLFGSKNSLNRIHVIGQTGDWQQVPAMATGHVVNAAVLPGRIIKPDPAGEVRHRRCAGPVRIVLMPCHNSAVARRLSKNLIVPKTNWSAQKLRGRHEEGRIPQQIMKARSDTPGA